MPWKPTKLKFCGLAVRRRTLYVLTLLFAIAAVPALSWAFMAFSANAAQDEKLGFVAPAAVVTLLAFIGWWTIVRSNSILFQHEARIIWPGAVVVLALATWLGYAVAQSSLKSGRHGNLAPLALGGAFMIFLIVRCFLLGRHPKRGDIVRGDGGRPRRRSRSPVAASTLPDGAAETDDLDEVWVEDEAESPDSSK